MEPRESHIGSQCEANSFDSMFLAHALQYKKPMQVLKLEELARSERAKLQGEKEGDVDCKQQ